MTDLQTLELLAKAESDAKRRLEAAEREAAKILSDSKAEADALEKRTKVDVAALREKGLRSARTEASKAAAEVLASKMDALDNAHPNDPVMIKTAAERILPRFEEWAKSRGLRDK